MIRCLIIVAASLLGGCSFLHPVHQQPFCGTAVPVYPQKGDVITLPTLRPIIANDNIGEKLCGWKPPKKSEGT